MSEKTVEEAKGTRLESGSMEETKGQTSRWPDERTVWRRETESRSWAEKRENKESDVKIPENLQQQRVRDAEMQRRSHETESRFRQQKRSRDTDWRGSESKRTCDERTQMRREQMESSMYPHRPGEKDCLYYLRTGECSYGRSCRYNHPARCQPTYCQYFIRGACRYGSACRNHHPKDMDGAEPVLFMVPGLPMRREQEQRDTERQRRETQENVQEQNHTDNTGLERREALENVQEQRFMEIPANQNVDAHDQQNLEEERKRDLENRRREARLRLEKMKPTVDFNEATLIRETLPELGIKRREGDGF